MNKQDYLSLRSPVERVPLPGDAVGYVRVMTGAERLEWVKIVDAARAAPSGRHATYALLARCIADEHGGRPFNDSPEDESNIGLIDCKVLDALRIAAMRVNGLALEGQEDAQKNSSSPPSSDSSSSSPDTSK